MAEAGFLLDASALLAYLHREPGWQRVRQAVYQGAVVGAVNLAEALGKLAEKGVDTASLTLKLRALGIRVEPFLADDALQAARLRPPTRSLGLSLGDRACLALGLRLGLPVLTADRAWAELDLPIEIEVVR